MIKIKGFLVVFAVFLPLLYHIIKHNIGHNLIMIELKNESGEA